jgi:hypothetical protein
METNPYAPPNSVVADVSVVAPEGIPLFFPVSVFKLLVLLFCTLGMYEYYWFYMNWKLVRDRTHEDISPFWRSFFGIFFCYQLFDRIRKDGSELTASRLPAGPLATAWIIATMLWRLSGAYWFVTFLAFFALVPVQASVNAVNQIASPDHDPNARFTAWNWVAVILGGPFFLLALYGTFFLPE